MADRIAQTVVAMSIGRLVDRCSAPTCMVTARGGRHWTRCGMPGKAACWRNDWIIDLDVRAFFDSVDHSLMLKAVARHTKYARWVLLYVARWLKAPMRQAGRGPWQPATGGPRKGQRYPRSWLTCICTMRSICGWPGNIRAWRSSVTVMMR